MQISMSYALLIRPRLNTTSVESHLARNQSKDPQKVIIGLCSLESHPCWASFIVFAPVPVLSSQFSALVLVPVPVPTLACYYSCCCQETESELFIGRKEEKKTLSWSRFALNQQQMVLAKLDQDLSEFVRLSAQTRAQVSASEMFQATKKEAA